MPFWPAFLRVKILHFCVATKVKQYSTFCNNCLEVLVYRVPLEMQQSRNYNFTSKKEYLYII
jgi:hypothetical protein